MTFISEGARRSLAALASATSANGTARNGTAVTTNSVHPGSLVADVSVTIVTGSVVATITHEVSRDNSTFTRLSGGPHNPAEVTITATATRVIPVPDGVLTFPFYRTVMTLSGASTAAGDLTVCTNRWMQYGELD